MIVEQPAGSMQSFVADSKTRKVELEYQPRDRPPAYSDAGGSVIQRRLQPPALPPRHAGPSSTTIASRSTATTREDYGPRSPRLPPKDDKLRGHSPRPTVDQVHIFERKEDIKGTYFVDPTIPALDKSHRKKGRSRHPPPHASFRSRRGDVTLDLATTGNVQQAPKANVNVSSLSGEIKINLLPVSPISPRIGLDACSRTGNVILFLPQGFSGVVHLSTRSGELDILPGLADVVKFVKRTEKEIIFMIDDHRNKLDTQDNSREASFCQLESRSGKLVVGLKNRWNIEEGPPTYSPKATSSDPKDVATVIEGSIDSLSSSLRSLSVKIHEHPELMLEEKYAHDLLSTFMATHGFQVTRNNLGLETAWRAEYSQGTGGRVIGINSEMDALRGMGHACGHNLIAISGVGVAIALKAALQARNDVSGKVVLLGTPAEESGGGKVILLERGAYDEMDVCIMSHPAPGVPHSSSVGSSNAMQSMTVEYFGQSAHAGAAPWDGTNALDAAFLAYSGISMLRQQMRPDHRVHGVVEGKNWSPNVIPDYSKMTWLARAPTYAELGVFVKRVQNCLQAAALATGCRINLEVAPPYFDLRQNPVLAQAFADIVGSRYNVATFPDGTSASTDFGNVSYAIPTEPQGGNHTPAFARAAISEAAHEATLTIAKGLALMGYRVLSDAEFFSKVKASFDQGKAPSL
ncbi:hypothetical protein NLJ89_g2854 [Agrocybe chaxingu]|uniref:Peptidase M20 dimerisation domain-containing protein n=1 Tax=Agrocybe chaxingu TaxID=84603 RepID=A0A9W8KBU4_9AGAR|nr:hypothetical protein NLJ89_g2854 [Agrocybe chaxingu]